MKITQPVKTTRHILVTGATRGLGRALVDGFVAQGHRVAGCGRRANEIATLRKTVGVAGHFSVVDVARDDDVAMWASRVLSEWGTPDLLINNAAVINAPRRLWEVSAAEFAQLTDININGVVNVIRHFVPTMVQRGRGVIANISSGWGRSTSPDVAPYCATKWAIEGLSQALAQELPPGLAAIAVNPGVICTDMLETAFGSRGARAYERPDEWSVRAVPFFLSLGPAHNGQAATVP
ncbi:MAG: SDR family oxidoreductase [Planctomycetota bacterium]